MADSCVTCTETLGQSTKRKASCKRRRSSEVRLAFLQKFHRVTASSCQRCLWAVSALLKACELFKEKLLFCSRISAAAKNKSQHIHASDVAVCVFSHVAARYHRFARLRFMRLLLWSPAVLKVTKGTKGLTRLAAGSMLVTVAAFAIKGNGPDLSPPRLPLLQLLSLLHAAGVFLDRIASFESCPTKHVSTRSRLVPRVLCL
jgi:hypothetical protein